MTASLFLGVDGGGTKTRFALLDGDRKLIAESTLGTSYHPEVGIDGVRGVLAEGLRDLLGKAGVDSSQIAFAFFGLPAFGEDSAVTPALEALPRSMLGRDRVAVDNDMVCGWAGSLAAEDGINIVAGTGSIGYGQRHGVSARAGGWGEHFSDEGSAYWIAMQGLNAYSRMSDGRMPKGRLHALLNEALALSNDLDICAQVYGPNARSRGGLAQLSQLVAAAATQGDAAAQDIFQRAGRELALIVDAIRRKLGFEAGESVKLSYSGGAFSAGELLLASFRATLLAASPNYRLVQPLHAPHIGAALYAAKLWKAGRR